MFKLLSLPYLFVLVLAVWRITHLFWGEDGPVNIFVRMRAAAGQGFFGRLLDCFYCLSVWIALPVACIAGTGWLERVLLWFALSGGAILLERATARTSAAPPPAAWRELPPQEGRKEENPDHVLLR
jgi:hypothetical protein